ncbi:MAG: hypothetical protein IPJ65_36675 [Archangiaceae bacterium]|nr:hypothetical protein [Archangiaceae bacterium]
MRRAAACVLLCVALACKGEKAPATVPLPAPKKFVMPRSDGGENPLEPSHLRPEPRGGEVMAGPGSELLLSGHTESILSVAFDASGKRCVTAGLDRSVRYWDLEQKKLLWAAGPGDEAVTAVAISPDGGLVAAGDRAFGVRLLDARGGTLVRRRAHPDAVSSLAFSPDGRWLAVGGAGGNAEIYPIVSDAKSVCELRGRTVGFTDQGKSVVSASPSGSLALTTFPACKKVKETTTAPHLPYAAVSGSAALVATFNGGEPFALLWDTRGGRMLGKLDQQAAGVTSVQLSSDGKRALVASGDGSVKLYDVEKREVLKSVQASGLPFAALSPDATRALITDGLTVRVVDLAAAAK